jgi:hypothetical protein
MTSSQNRQTMISQVQTLTSSQAIGERATSSQASTR